MAQQAMTLGHLCFPLPLSLPRAVRVALALPVRVRFAVASFSCELLGERLFWSRLQFDVSIPELLASRYPPRLPQRHYSEELGHELSRSREWQRQRERQLADGRVRPEEYALARCPVFQE